MDKQKILSLVVESLEKEEAILIAAGLAAKEAATESEAKPENQYDTRGLEQSYLAAGQAKRAEVLKMSIINLKALSLNNFKSSSPIDISALASLQDKDGETKTYFILPTNGGIKVKYQNREISTLSPESPLADAILGKTIGETIEVKLGGQTRSYSITAIE